MNLDEYKAKRPPNREAVDAHKAEMEREVAAAATLGFVVLAKRPAPRTEHGWTYEVVDGPFEDIADANHSCDNCIVDDAVNAGQVEYVIGEIVPVTR